MTRFCRARRCDQTRVADPPLGKASSDGMACTDCYLQGISLSIDQFKGVIEALPEIEASLKAKKIELPRPVYDSGGAAASEDEQFKDEVKAEEEDDEKVPVESSKGKLDKFKMGRGNHEATSDEEE